MQPAWTLLEIWVHLSILVVVLVGIEKTYVSIIISSVAFPILHALQIPKTEKGSAEEIGEVEFFFWPRGRGK